MPTYENLREKFGQIFGARSEHEFRAPGRVNLIGEHTDYNGGFVLPMAIDREAHILARRRADRTVRLVAMDLASAESLFSLDDITHDVGQPWSNYVRGVAMFLRQRGAQLPGMDLLIHSDVPIGSGLSSSAALEVCAATGFQFMSGFFIGAVETARLCQQVENQFVGVNSGIMDQFISVLAREGHALLIDCLDLSYQNVPMPDGATIVVCDTLKRRGLVTSEYNTRRAECEQAARTLGVPMLRDLNISDLGRMEQVLPPVVARRARHVVTEDARVLAAVEAMRTNDLVRLGRLMDESHTSLRDDYEVSCPELDTLIEIALRQQGCLGARLTGAGFGGCTANLVQNEAIPAFVASVGREYKAKTGLDAPIYVCHAAAGANVVSLPKQA